MPLSVFSDMFIVKCSELLVLFHMFAFIIIESIANVCANIGKTRFSKIGPEPDALSNASKYMFRKAGNLPNMPCIVPKKNKH